MEKTLSFFATELCVGITEHKSNGGKEVTFTGAISTN